MPSIAPTFITYTTKHPSSRVRHLKNFSSISLNTVTRPRILKKSIDFLQQSKCHSVATFENIERIPAKALSLVIKAVQNSSKFLKKAIFKCATLSQPAKAQPHGLKRLFRKLSHIRNLTLINFEARYLKYCRSLRNLSISIPEDPKASMRALTKVRRLNRLDRAEVSVSSAEQALMTMKEAQKGANSKHCCLGLTFLKTVWPCMDNIEAISGPSFKKVAEVQMDLAKLPSTLSAVDHEKLKSHLKFLRFLLESTRKGESKNKGFESINFPGMKLELDQSEYKQSQRRCLPRKQLKDLDLKFTGSPIESFVENCLFAYSSSKFSCLDKFDVNEYSPEQNQAKLSLELKSGASPKEVTCLVNDIVEFKDIQSLHLELEAKRMSSSDLKLTIEKISKIEKLEYLHITAGNFKLELQHPCKARLGNLLDSERGQCGRVRA